MLEGNKLFATYPMSHLQASAFLGGLQKVRGERELVIMPCGELIPYDFVLERLMRWKRSVRNVGCFGWSCVIRKL
jgi:hypothetical protein